MALSRWTTESCRTKLKDVRYESESQTTIRILITSYQCFIILLYFTLNSFKPSDPTKVTSKWVGHNTNAEYKQLRRTVRCYRVSQQRGWL